VSLKNGSAIWVVTGGSRRRKQMKIEQAQIEELKKRHGAIYEGAVSFNDDEDKFHEVEFVWRKPVTADIEAHAKASQRNPVIANLNLIQSLIVYPEPGTVIERMREYPAAYGRFVDEAVSPFFGANVSVRNRKL
jgi:hypothetical protein